MKQLGIIMTALIVFAATLPATARPSRRETKPPAPAPNLRRTYTTVPPEAEPLYQLRESSYQDDENYLRANILQKIAKSEANRDLELTCHTLLYVWDYSTETSCSEGTGWGPGKCLNPFNHVFGSTKFIKVNTMSVEAYCVKRSFDQKMLLSLVRQCEASPTMECYQMKDSFKEINPLYRINLKK